jgi:hypothetical protein
MTLASGSKTGCNCHASVGRLAITPRLKLENRPLLQGARNAVANASLLKKTITAAAETEQRPDLPTAAAEPSPFPLSRREPNEYSFNPKQTARSLLPHLSKWQLLFYRKMARAWIKFLRQFTNESNKMMKYCITEIKNGQRSSSFEGSSADLLRRRL